MHDFRSDYGCGAHPAVLQEISEVAGMEAGGSYGEDIFSQTAEKLILRRLGLEAGTPSTPPAKVFFVPSGSAANRLAIATLAPYPFQAIVCSEVAHVARHEAGSAESLGHKLILLPHGAGRLEISSVHQAMGVGKDNIHCPQPHLLCVSNATECGTTYFGPGLRRIVEEVPSLKVHCDGARISNVVAAHGGEDLLQYGRLGSFGTLSIGMAKNGGVLGDILVVCGEENIQNAKYLHKQAGYLSPNMQFYAAQAIALFDGNLWLENAKNANAMATLLAARLKELHIDPAYPVETNAVFVRLPWEATRVLRNRNLGIVWSEEQRIVRFMCTYKTSVEEVESLLKVIKAIRTE